MDAPLLPAKPEIPDHELLRVIGAGSYGEVWLARTVFGVYRAIKIVRRSAFSDSRPFDREFSGLKRFEPISRRHDSLLDILHVGRNETHGYFYCIMELGDDVVGAQQIDPATYQVKTLAGEVARHGGLPLDECIRIGISISSGLRVLHSNQLIHRDIKPANIVFINGIPKLADIGLVHSLTSVGSLVGTDGYIPPEGPGSIQADIYALGKVLYEISTGNDRQDFPELPDEIRKKTDLADFSEFNEVLARACEAEREKRYATVDDLHADLRVLEAGKSVLRLRTLERRARFFTKASLATVAVLVIGGLLSWTYYAQYTRAKRAKADQAAMALNYGGRLIEEGNLFGALGWFVDSLALDSGNAARNRTDRTRIASVLRAAPHLAQCWWLDQQVCDAEMSRDGRYVIAALKDGSAQIIERANGSNVLKVGPEGKSRDTVYRTARFNTAGNVFAISGQSDLISIWSFPDGRLIRTLHHPTRAYSVRFSTDDSKIITSGEGGTVVLWDARTGDVIRSFTGLHTAVFSARFSPTDDRVVAGSSENVAIIWETETGKILRVLPHGQWVGDAAFSPDGRLVATGCNDLKARIWDATTGAPILQALPHEKGVSSVEFSPDGRFLATSTYAFSVYIWDIKTGEMAASILRHDALTQMAQFSPDSRFILTGALDGSVRFWDLHRASHNLIAGFTTADGNRAFRPNGRQVSIANVSDGSTITNYTFSNLVTRVWSDSRGNRFLARDDSEGEAEGFEIATGSSLRMKVPAGRLISETPDVVLADTIPLATVTRGRVLETWDLIHGELLNTTTYSTNVAAVISPDGGYVAALSGTNLHLLRASDLKPLFAPIAHRLPVSCAAFSRDGTKLVTGCKDGSLEGGYARVWNTASGLPLSPEMPEADGITTVAFSPDAKQIATGGEDFVARVWDLALNKGYPPFQHQHQLITVKFSDDGKWLFTGSYDLTARVWEIETGAAVTPPLRHNWPVRNVALLPDKNQLVTRSASGMSAAWNLQPDAQPIADLTTTSKFLSGSRSTKPEARPIVQGILKAYASGSLTDSAPWHEAQARMAEFKRDYSCAKFHLVAEIKAAGPNDQLLRRLGFAQAMEREYAGALKTWKQLMELEGPKSENVVNARLLELQLSRESSETAGPAISTFSERELITTPCAWLLALGKPIVTNLVASVASADKGVDGDAKAALLWRMGKPENALVMLRTNTTPVSSSLEAVILAHSGRNNEAQLAMTTARQRRLVASGTWVEQVCLDLLDREFDALLASTPSESKSKPLPRVPTEAALSEPPR